MRNVFPTTQKSRTGVISSANKIERQDQSPCNGDLRVGDRVRIKTGTLTWSGEPKLRKHVGEVIAAYHDESGTARVTVEFPVRRLLPRREASIFVLAERQQATT
jgi:hypothetical protein